VKNFSPKLLNNLFILIATAIILLIWVTQINVLNNRSYILKQSDLFKIDSVNILSRAFIVGGGKSSKSIEFEDENRKLFLISGPRLSSLVDRSKLYDTLQYSNLIISVFTTKIGFNNYYNENNYDKIDVYDIKVGDISFINLEDVNSEEYYRRLSLIIFFSIAYGICLLAYFYFRKKG
jgi:hypothetical protein